MKAIVSVMLLVALSLSLCQLTWPASGVTNAEPLQRALPVAGDKFSDADLDEMLADIALYPDPLLAQMLPAATFIEQLDEAQRLLNGYANDDAVDLQNWDASVKAVAHYPSILARMVEKQDWTVAVGQAWVAQKSDVEESIQRLRRLAYNAGVLVTTPEQKVIVETDYIAIEPTQADAIYEPVYDAGYGYDYAYGGVPAWYWGPVRFGRRLAIGAWLNRAWRWGGADSGPYYHGWKGNKGWVGYSRNSVNVNNKTYINDGLKQVNVDPGIRDRSVSAYRDSLEATRVNNASIANINNAIRKNTENFERANPNTNFDGTPRQAGVDNTGYGFLDRDWGNDLNNIDRRDGRLDNFRGRDGVGDRLENRDRLSDRGLGDVSGRDVANRQRERGAASRASAPAPARAPAMRGGGGGRRR